MIRIDQTPTASQGMTFEKSDALYMVKPVFVDVPVAYPELSCWLSSPRRTVAEAIGMANDEQSGEYETANRTSVVYGTSVVIRVALGGRRIFKNITITKKRKINKT